MALSYLVNGELGPHELQHFCNGCCKSKEHCVLKMEHYICDKLLSCGPQVFHRHKWTGVEKSIDFFSALHCLGLLEPALETLWGKKSSKKKTEEATDETDGANGQDEDPHTSQQLASLGDGFLQAGGSQEQNDTEGTDFKVICKKWREMGLAWSKRPNLLLEMILARLAVAPHCRLMAQELAKSGHSYDSNQLQNEVLTGQRSYRVLDSYLDKGTKEAMAELFATMQRDFTIELGDNCCTSEAICLAFRLFSRSAASLHHYCLTKRQKFPYRFFGLLVPSEDEQLSLADEIFKIYQDTPCLLDAGSKGFLDATDAKEPKDLLTEDSKAMLKAIACQAQTSIAHIECQHAANRRFIMSRVQTKAHSLGTASAQFIARYLRRSAAAGFHAWTHAPPRWQQKRRSKRGPKPKAKARSGKFTYKTSKRLVRGGGAWTVFLSDMNAPMPITEEGKRRFKELALLYKSLSLFELRSLKERALTARMCSRFGHRRIISKIKKQTSKPKALCNASSSNCVNQRSGADPSPTASGVVALPVSTLSQKPCLQHGQDQFVEAAIQDVKVKEKNLKKQTSEEETSRTNCLKSMQIETLANKAKINMLPVLNIMTGCDHQSGFRFHNRKLVTAPLPLFEKGSSTGTAGEVRQTLSLPFSPETPRARSLFCADISSGAMWSAWGKNAARSEPQAGFGTDFHVLMYCLFDFYFVVGLVRHDS